MTTDAFLTLVVIVLLQALLELVTFSVFKQNFITCNPDRGFRNTQMNYAAVRMRESANFLFNFAITMEENNIFAQNHFLLF
jgi:hypothetical protein